MENVPDPDQSVLNSIVQINANEAFPKKSSHFDENNLHVPLPLLCGEYLAYVGCIAEGTIALSNYRLFVHMKNNLVNIPIGLLEYVESRNIFFLYIYCKDARTVRCTFATNDASLEWYRRLLFVTKSSKKIADVFAFAHYAWCLEENRELHSLLSNADNSQNFLDEVYRMGFNLKTAWRISHVNKNYTLCASYPPEVLVPGTITDEDLENAAKFRSSQRFPVVVWRHKTNGSVIARCSQPEVGWLGWRNSFDENLVKAISVACSVDGKKSEENGLNSTGHDEDDGSGCVNVDEKEAIIPSILIMDARSYAAAFANRAKGGGCENPEYYPNCEIQFMSLANIHYIRKSFQSVRTLCSSAADQTNWFSILESTNWLQHISGLLKSALIVVNTVDVECRPVIVHCSDGWDRTPQIVALAELMLDPYYQTMEGFQVLVEREWLDFGHKFGDRCGHGIYTDDANERCPVFLQWLDCVCQLQHQFPVSFEFNGNYLVKLAHHVYSCLYGTFLCNSDHERKMNHVALRTYSVWSFLRHNQNRFRNYLYMKQEKVLRPSCNLRDLIFWKEMYLQACDSDFDLMYDVPHSCQEGGRAEGEDLSSTAKRDRRNSSTSTPVVTSSALVKTRSCADLSLDVERSGAKRRLSDPNVNETFTSSSDFSPFFKIGFNASHDDDDDALDDNKANDGQRDSLYDTESCVSDDSFLPNGNCDGPIGAKVSDGERGYDSENDDDIDVGMDVRTIMDRLSDFALTSGSDSGTAKLHPGWSRDMESSTDTIVENVSSTARLNGSATAVAKQQVVCDSQYTSAGHPGANNSCLSNEVVGCGSSCVSCKEKCLCSSSTACPGGACASVNDKRFTVGLCDLAWCCRRHHQLPDDAQRSCMYQYFHLPSSSLCFCNGERQTNGHTKHQLVDLKVLSKNNDCCMKCMLLDQQRSALDNELESFPNGLCYEHVQSSVTTPMLSRTPSSGLPASPNDDRLLERGDVNPQPLQFLARMLDVDGLPVLQDEVQQRLQEILLQNQRRLNNLQQSLCMAKVALRQQVCFRCKAALHGGVHHQEEGVCDSGNTEQQQQQHHSNHDSASTSDISWEQVEEGDTRPTLWVPDHAVTHCTGCDSAFCIVRRKHHCRNCGKIFCSDCSSQMTPIPNEQLYHPVRVCAFCFDKLRYKGVSSDLGFHKMFSQNVSS